MLLLLVDTAGSTGGVLLARNEIASPGFGETEVLGTRALEPRQFSIQLITAIAELLHASHLSVADVDAFAVVSGPGSFTGLRVGLSAVKAMAEAMAQPVIALSRLAVMASVADLSKPQKSTAEPLHTVLDAGRGEFYHGIYREAGWTCVSESLDTLPSLTASLENVPGALIACEPSVLTVLADFSPHQIPDVSVGGALPLTLAAWQASRFTDVALLDANYLRRLDPERGPRRGTAETKAGAG